MSNSPTLVNSYKRLILGAAAFYIALGSCIYLIISGLYHPEIFRNAVLSWLAGSYLQSSPLYQNITAWVIALLTLLLLLRFPVIMAGKPRLRHVPIPYREGMDHMIDMITEAGEQDMNYSTGQPLPPVNSGTINNTKGMLMVADGKIMFVNKDFCQQTGFAPAEVIGRDFVEFIPTYELPKYAMLVRSARRNEVLQPVEIEISCPNRKKYILKVAANKGAAANPNDLCLFYLKEPEAGSGLVNGEDDFFARSLEATSACIWMWDKEGLIYINSNCRKFLNIPLGMLVKNPGFLMKVFSSAERKEVALKVGRYSDTLFFNEELNFTDAQGQLHWFKVEMYPCRDKNGFISHHIGVASEITEQRQHVTELETSCEKAVIANYNKTAFLANMSHEIRSPLNGILGFSELLVDPGLSLTDRDRYHSIIKNNGAILLTILSDIIDISKLESGKMKIVEKGFVPADLLRELQMQFTDDPNATEKGLNLKWFIGEDTPAASLMSDRFRIRQVLVNLITNALKYSEHGEIEIASEWWGDRAVFWVKDTGVGIPEESLPYIFDRYRQVLRSDSSNNNGFGLGLAICKALVELLGGNIWVESEAGHGSVFYFTIPNKTPNPKEMNNLNSSETAFPYDWKGRTILIAEDIDFSFLYIEAVLRRTGAKVLWAQNGREAIDMVKVNPSIDIALMDIHMPIMNGYDATKEIIKIRPDLPVIAQTAFVLPDDVKACYAAGCAGYLAKPIRREQLLNTLTEYFDKIDQNAEMQAGNVPVYRSKIS